MNELLNLSAGAICRWGPEIEVTLDGAPTTIQLTETYLADVQACIRAEEAGTRGEAV